jgi:hypothetical protein
MKDIERERKKEKGGKRKRGCFSASLPTLKTETTQIRKKKNQRERESELKRVKEINFGFLFCV